MVIQSPTESASSRSTSFCVTGWRRIDTEGGVNVPRFFVKPNVGRGQHSGKRGNDE